MVNMEFYKWSLIFNNYSFFIISDNLIDLSVTIIDLSYEEVITYSLFMNLISRITSECITAYIFSLNPN